MGRTLPSAGPGQALSAAFDLDLDFDLDREGHGFSRAEKRRQATPASAAEGTAGGKMPLAQASPVFHRHTPCAWYSSRTALWHFLTARRAEA